MSDFRVALFISDGVGIRNFVLGGFLKELAQRGSGEIFHILPDHLVQQYAAQSPAGIEWRPMLDYNQSRLIFLLQSSLAYAHMYWANTGSMQRATNKPARGSLKRRIFVHSSRLLGRMGADPARIKMIDSVHFAMASRLQEVEAYKQLFRKTRPSVLFSASQRPHTLVPAVLAAKALGIPTATFIVSWDNLSSKGRIVAPFEHYFVWSNYMRDEMLRYYPHVQPENIHVVGTPQFDSYADPALLWTREEFFSKFAGDPSRPLICFSGGDAGTCPEDPDHVRILMEFVRSGKIHGRPQVIVRPAPVDDCQRYETVRREFPELIFAKPDWIHTRPGDWTRCIPTAGDVQFLANLTHHSDLNVNLGSTMTLDFGLHDKPVVNVAFDVADPPLFGMPVYDYYYNYEHFRPVVELGASRIARRQCEFADHVNACLDDPGLDREGRKKLVNLHVTIPPGQSSRVVLETLQRLA